LPHDDGAEQNGASDMRADRVNSPGEPMRRGRWRGGRGTIAAVEAVAAVLLVLAAVASWRTGVVDTSFAAQGDVPAHDSVRYSGPWLVGAAALAALAGLLVVDAVVRVRRGQSPQF